MQVNSYRDLRVWQQAMDLVEECYQLTKKLPSTKIYGLVSQIQRAAVSIPANIAEGKGRANLGEYLYHLSVANGSLMELETHILIADRLSYLKPSEVQLVLSLTQEVGRKLNRLRQRLREKKGVSRD